MSNGGQDLRKQRGVKIINDATEPIPVEGELVVVAGGQSSTVAAVSASITEVTLVATNTDRTGVTLTNDSSNILYVKYGTGVSAGSYTFKLRKNDYAFIDDYRGQITGVWNGTNGVAHVTETF